MQFSMDTETDEATAIAILRERSSTLDNRSSDSKIRPPRRKRRPSYDVPPVTVTDQQHQDFRQHGLRSGSVPPMATPMTTQSSPALLSPPPAAAVQFNSGHSPLPMPRIRRLSSRQQKIGLGGGVGQQSCMSQPGSGANTPDIHRGSSALDLSDLTPFGSLHHSPQPSSMSSSSASHQQQKSKRVSLKTSRSSGTSSNRWNWIWSRKDCPDSASTASGTTTMPLKYTGSLLGGRKRKSRHISCPDISSASDESSRSTSPVTFKVSLTSLFGVGHHHNNHSRPSTTASPTTSSTPMTSSSFRRPLSLHKHKRSSSGIVNATSSGCVKAVTAASSNLAAVYNPIVSQQQVVADLTTEVVAVLAPVQYCQITNPYEHFFVEFCDVEFCSHDLPTAVATIERCGFLPRATRSAS